MINFIYFALILIIFEFQTVIAAAALEADLILSKRFLSACEKKNCDKSINECFALGVNISLFHNGEIPLIYAVKNDRLHLFKELLKMGENVNIKNSDGDTALHLACSLGKYAFVLCILEYGADINSRNRSLYIPLHYACESCRLDISMLLVWCVDAYEEADWTPLHLACKAGCVELVKFLLENSADFTLQDVDGWTALHNAVFSKNIRVVNELLRSGADIHALDEMDKSPFSMACSKGLFDIVKLMLNYANCVNIDEALLSACHSNNVELVQFFVKMGAYIICQDEDKWTPLHFAYSYANNDVIKYLLAQGADVDARELKNKTPSEYKRIMT